MSGSNAAELPRWADLVLLPLVNLFLALLVTAGVSWPWASRRWRR